MLNKPVSKHAKPVPKHRGAPNRPVSVDAPKKALRTTLVMSSVAVAATGATISTGLLSSAPASVSATAADLGDAFPDAGQTGQSTVSGTTDRDQVVSRSGGDRRAASDPVKVSALSQDTGGAMSVTESLSDDDPRDIARALLGEFGFSSDQFGCLDSLWTRESGWSISADNPSSTAYGIPQALPGSKMASEGADWATNPVTQIRWGLGYIRDRYGSPCGAWSHSESSGWY